MERYNRERLTATVRRAYRHSPGYGRLLEERLGPDVGDRLDAIEPAALPKLSRGFVRRHHEELRLRHIPRPLTKKKSTSGTSTGVPLAFHEDLGSVAREHAFLTDLWSRIGYRRGDRVAVLRGNVVAADTGGRPWARYGSHLLLSSYHLTEQWAGELADALRSFRPRWLHVYPSTLYAFCRLVDRDRCRDLGVEGILAGSEKLYDWQRELFEERFDARVLHWYGMAEKVALAGGCEHSSRLHLYPQYGHLQLEPVEGDGARVVGTSFVHAATPFIRYDTGDIVRMASDRYCSACGRPYPLIEEVVGRDQEFVVTKGDMLLPLSEAVGSIHGALWEDVERWQLVQERPGSVAFLVQTAEVGVATKAEQIEMEFARRFGEQLEVEVVPTEVPSAGPGKYRYFIQRLDVSAYRHA